MGGYMDIQVYRNSDFDALLNIYRECFTGFPWFNKPSYDDAFSRLDRQLRRTDCICLVAKVDKKIIGASWCDEILLVELEQERGGVEASSIIRVNFSDMRLIWLRATIVSPAYQGQGLTKKIKIHLHDQIKLKYTKPLIVTRMRSDNIPIIKINTELGYKKLGVATRSKLDALAMDEYWYFEL